MKKFALYLIIFLPTYLSAQPKPQPLKPYSEAEVKDAKHDADELYKARNFAAALKNYERLVLTEPNNSDYNFKAGECYLNSNINKAKAVPYLEFAAKSNAKERPKDVLFELAKAYLYAGLYDQAIEYFEKFRTEKKGTVDAKLLFNDWVNWANNAKTITANPVNCTFENLGKGINTAYAEYRPIIGASDTIVYFSSKRKGNTGGLTDDFGDFPSDIYSFTQNDTSRSKAKNAGTNINTEFYEESMFLNMFGDKMLIYREGPESNGDIYISQLAGKQWNKPVVLSKDFITKVPETGACLSPDGLTLYFSAEAEGSKTKKDIYRCTRTESTSWGKPERLSDNINTKGDEDNPYLWLDGKTLFFSSTGFNSMGGYDIFRSVMNSPSEGFSKPENIGYPLNSVYDDIGIAIEPDGKTMYLSAVRDSGFGDMDIYKVVTNEPVVAAPMASIHGIALANTGGPAKGAFVIVTDATTGAKIANCETNAGNGTFDLAVPAGNYKVTLRHAKFGKTEREFTVNPTAEPKLYLELKFE